MGPPFWKPAQSDCKTSQGCNMGAHPPNFDRCWAATCPQKGNRQSRSVPAKMWRSCWTASGPRTSLLHACSKEDFVIPLAHKSTQKKRLKRGLGGRALKELDTASEERRSSDMTVQIVTRTPPPKTPPRADLHTYTPTQASSHSIKHKQLI